MRVGVAVGRGVEVFVGVREGCGDGVADGCGVGSTVWDGVGSASATSASIGSINSRIELANVGVGSAVPSVAHPVKIEIEIERRDRESSVSTRRLIIEY